MSQIIISSVTNCNVYINGIGLIGRASEVEVPHPKQKLVDHKGLGMVGGIKVWAGVEPLEATIKWASFDFLTLSLAMAPFTAQRFQVRGNLVQDGSAGVVAELPIVYHMTGKFHDAGKSPFKQHEMVENTTMVNVTHSELFIAGVQVYLYDAFANIYVVNGVDMLANFRTNTGG
jgi:P2 family phage contractile tail tube protein